MNSLLPSSGHLNFAAWKTVFQKWTMVLSPSISASLFLTHWCYNHCHLYLKDLLFYKFGDPHARINKAFFELWIEQTLWVLDIERNRVFQRSYHQVLLELEPGELTPWPLYWEDYDYWARRNRFCRRSTRVVTYESHERAVSKKGEDKRLSG